MIVTQFLAAGFGTIAFALLFGVPRRLGAPAGFSIACCRPDWEQLSPPFWQLFWSCCFPGSGRYERSAL